MLCQQPSGGEGILLTYLILEGSIFLKVALTTVPPYYACCAVLHYPPGADSLLPTVSLPLPEGMAGGNILVAAHWRTVPQGRRAGGRLEGGRGQHLQWAWRMLTSSSEVEHGRKFYSMVRDILGGETRLTIQYKWARPAWAFCRRLRAVFSGRADPNVGGRIHWILFCIQPMPEAHTILMDSSQEDTYYSHLGGYGGTNNYRSHWVCLEEEPMVFEAEGVRLSVLWTENIFCPILW